MNQPVVNLKVVRSVINRPASLARDHVAIRVTIQLPDKALDPLTLASLIVVPAAAVQRGPVRVLATGREGVCSDYREEDGLAGCANCGYPAEQHPAQAVTADQCPECEGRESCTCPDPDAARDLAGDR